jgi:hypothetical protein
VPFLFLARRSALSSPHIVRGARAPGRTPYQRAHREAKDNGHTVDDEFFCEKTAETEVPFLHWTRFSHPRSLTHSSSTHGANCDYTRIVSYDVELRRVLALFIGSYSLPKRSAKVSNYSTKEPRLSAGCPGFKPVNVLLAIKIISAPNRCRKTCAFSTPPTPDTPFGKRVR